MAAVTERLQVVEEARVSLAATHEKQIHGVFALRLASHDCT
jgi:hypothetical protein